MILLSSSKENTACYSHNVMTLFLQISCPLSPSLSLTLTAENIVDGMDISMPLSVTAFFLFETAEDDMYTTGIPYIINWDMFRIF